MKPLAADDVVITGLGMCTSLGNTVQACAAARAGLSLARELPGVTISLEDGEDAAIVGHAVATSAGFRGIGKLVCLGLEALKDLLKVNDVRLEAASKTGFYLCLPARPAAAAEGAPAPLALDVHSLCSKLSSLSSLSLPEGNWHSVEAGNAGFVRAVIEASAKLRTGEWHRCLVGGVDSLVEESALGRLLGERRLKTPDKPDGLQPGEAAAFLVLERLDMARRRGARALAVVQRASLVPDAGVGPAEEGNALARALSSVLGAAGAQPPWWLVSDHNGEHRRATALGIALTRLPAHATATLAGTPWYPATSFGHTGAASAAIAAGAVSRAFAHGYAPSAAAVIASSSDNGTHAALHLGRAPET